jgi:hypothetical protein
MTTDPRFETFGSRGVSLRDELGGVFTDERLHDWIGDSDARRDFLADMILGTITWDRAMGSPAHSPAVRGVRCRALVPRPGGRGGGGLGERSQSRTSTYRDDLAASVLQASGFRGDATVFRLNARPRLKTGSEPPFRRNTAERAYTIEAAHHPGGRRFKSCPRYSERPLVGKLLTH